MLAAVMCSFCNNQPRAAGRHIEVERFGTSDKYYLVTNKPLDRYQPFFELNDQQYKYLLRNKHQIGTDNFECFHTERDNLIRINRFNNQEFKGQDNYHTFNGRINPQHYDRVIIFDGEYPNVKFEYQVRFC